MNIYVGALIKNQPLSTADANYANIIPCKAKFVIPSVCDAVQRLSRSDTQLVLSRVVLLKCIISILIIKSTCRFPGREISPCDAAEAFAALQILSGQQERGRTPQKSAFDASSTSHS